jgi:arylformamidase
VIKGAAALSGLFNLIPILLSEVNEGVKLDKETALRNSAVQLEPAHACPLLLAVGGDESMEFKDQSKELYISWKDKGVPVTLLELPGINHYSIVETFAETPSSLYSAMLQLMK